MDIKRGDLFLAQLDGCVGCETRGASVFVTILQNDVGNKFSPTVIAAVVKPTQAVKKAMPTHVYVKLNGAFYSHIVTLEQIRTLDKSRLKHKVGALSFDELEEIDRTLESTLNLDNSIKFDSKTIKRGEIYFADMSGWVGSEQGGNRPVLVVQNDLGNFYSPCTIVLSITSQIQKAKLPTHVELNAALHGLEKDSVLLSEQIRTIDKARLQYKVTELDELTMRKINDSIMVSLGMHQLGSLTINRRKLTTV